METSWKNRQMVGKLILWEDVGSRMAEELSNFKVRISNVRISKCDFKVLVDLIRPFYTERSSRIRNDVISLEKSILTFHLPSCTIYIRYAVNVKKTRYFLKIFYTPHQH